MCDTFVALPDATADGSVIFGKNSDRPSDEAQRMVRFPAAEHPPGATVRCTYIEIPQAERTHAVLLSQPTWMWGAEMGANAAGVVIGNEAVWTTEPLGPPALLGMDLVRLGLERGATARAALDVMTGLLEACGQGGACAEGDPSFAYHNSFLIADPHEAWVLETAGRHWAAQRIVHGTRNISNALTIRDDYHLCSAGIAARGRIDFAATFSTAPADPPPWSRQACGTSLLGHHAGRITPEVMMAILRDHGSGICMHGMFTTTASMVSRLAGPHEHEHWATDRPYPCANPFVPFGVEEPVSLPA